MAEDQHSASAESSSEASVGGSLGISPPHDASSLRLAFIPPEECTDEQHRGHAAGSHRTARSARGTGRRGDAHRRASLELEVGVRESRPVSRGAGDAPRTLGQAVRRGHDSLHEHDDRSALASRWSRPEEKRHPARNHRSWTRRHEPKPGVPTRSPTFVSASRCGDADKPRNGRRTGRTWSSERESARGAERRRPRPLRGTSPAESRRLPKDAFLIKPWGHAAPPKPELFQIPTDPNAHFVGAPQTRERGEEKVRVWVRRWLKRLGF